MSCASCIASWQQRDQTCPNCRAEISLGKSVNRFAMQQLNQTVFRCDKCPAEFKYADKEKHWEKCGIEFRCQLAECSSRPFEREDQLREHWQEQCLMVMVKCHVCKNVLQRRSTSTHDCVPFLVERIGKLTARLEDVQEQLENRSS